uniref:SH3 domain-containing protein n=1 Tax=Caenorhabditis tropicalis TaxID=1561998 RepID=A0A1I7TBM2_9PELO
MLVPSADSEHRTGLTVYQENMKRQHDLRNAVRANDFQVGEKVFVRIQCGNKWKWGYGVVKEKVGKMILRVESDGKIHRCHVNQVRSRIGEREEDKFAKVFYPLFFGSVSTGASPTGADGNSTSQAFEKGGRRGANSCEFPVSPVSRPVSWSPVVRAPRGRESAIDTLNYEYDIMNKSTDVTIPTPSTRVSSSSSPKTMAHPSPAAPVDILLPDTDWSRVGPRADATTNPSHPLRRSTRPHRAPQRYDPCPEPYRIHSDIRTTPAPAHQGSRPPYSVASHPTSSVRRGGVAARRGRPRWQ